MRCTGLSGIADNASGQLMKSLDSSVIDGVARNEDSMGEMFARLATEDEHWTATLPELTGDEIRLAIANGWIANLRDADGDLVRELIASDDDYSGAFLEAPLPTARIDLDTLALVLRAYSGLSRADGINYDPRGLRLRQLLVDCAGGDLNGLDLAFPLVFQGCVFAGALNLDRVCLPELRFDTCLWLGDERHPVQSPYLSSVQLHKAQIAGDLDFFNCEGMLQFFAPDARIGSLVVREDGIEMPAQGAAAFRTVLTGARIGELTLDGDADPHRVLPAGECGGLQVESVSISSSASGFSEAEWIAKWLSGGTPPRWTRPIGSWGSDAVNDHHVSAWRSIAAALSEAGYESFRRNRGLGVPAYRDQGLELKLLADRHRDSKLGIFSRFARWLSLDLTVRYFTANVRALGWLIVVWLGVSVLAWCNIADLWRGTDSDGSVLVAPADGVAAGVDGVLWAGAYGLDIVVSPLQLGFDAVWPTSTLLLAVFALFKLVSLGLFSLFIVGLSGVITRSR